MVAGGAMDNECNNLLSDETQMIEVHLEPFLHTTLGEPDVATIESILMEALGLFEEI